MPAFLPARLLTAGLVVALAAGISLPANAAGPAPQPSSRAAKAQETLAEATSLFTGTTSATLRRTARRTGSARDATMVLRDLARRADDLPTQAQRRTAGRILARPTTRYDPTGDDEPKYTTAAGTTCGPHVCVHWVEDSSPDSVQTGNDGTVRTVPAQASLTLTTMEKVYTAEVTNRGYRAPLPDGVKGGDEKIDVYLAELGAHGLYGYCASDDPAADSTRQVFAYCVLDNDYDDFGEMHTPLENLQVTAAHEFFHAVQFAYDATEDAWFMEGTAAWMEDEVYDAVDDNLQYLAQSPLSSPTVPMDYSDQKYLPYGSWVFWRFLSEWQGAGAADDPSVVRKIWEAARGTTYSTSAVTKVLTARGDTFTDAFTRFGTWSRNPSAYFSEGASYPAAPRSNAFTLSTSTRSTGPRARRYDHLTHRFYRVTPDATLTGSWGLDVVVNMARRSRGSVARVVLHKQDGTLAAYSVPLNFYGNGSRTFDFRPAVVKYAEVELGNASTRFDCYRGTTQSCRGVSLDDALVESFTASAVRT